MTAFGLTVHVHGCGRVFLDFGPRLLASVGQSFLGIVHDKLFTKGIDEVFGAACDDELIGLAGCKLHRVAYHVSP